MTSQMNHKKVDDMDDNDTTAIEYAFRSAFRALNVCPEADSLGALQSTLQRQQRDWKFLQISGEFFTETIRNPNIRKSSTQTYFLGSETILVAVYDGLTLKELYKIMPGTLTADIYSKDSRWLLLGQRLLQSRYLCFYMLKFGTKTVATIVHSEGGDINLDNHQFLYRLRTTEDDQIVLRRFDVETDEWTQLCVYSNLENLQSYYYKGVPPISNFRCYGDEIYLLIDNISPCTSPAVIRPDGSIEWVMAHIDENTLEGPSTSVAFDGINLFLASFHSDIATNETRLKLSTSKKTPKIIYYLEENPIKISNHSVGLHSIDTVDFIGSFLVITQKLHSGVPENGVIRVTIYDDLKRAPMCQFEIPNSSKIYIFSTHIAINMDGYVKTYQFKKMTDYKTMYNSIQIKRLGDARFSFC